MNQLPCIIDEVITEGHLSVVKVKAATQTFTAIVIDTPASAPYLRKGKHAFMLFKENEVVIAKSFSGQISLQNRFESSIKEIELGKLLCKVVMDYQGFELVSLITAQAAIQLNLAAGDRVTAMVKTNEISLSPHD